MPPLLSSQRAGAASLCLLALLATSCATAGTAPDRAAVDREIRDRTNAGLRTDENAGLPPNTTLEDGLSSQEAVAIALWNSPAFQATLADLGIARAELVDAGLLRNPVFSLLFPVGP